MITKTLPMTVRSAPSLGPLECEAVMTTATVDAEGDTIAVDGWRLDRFMKNPCVLLGHDHKALPVGKVTAITPTRDGLRARIAFPDAGIFGAERRGAPTGQKPLPKLCERGLPAPPVHAEPDPRGHRLPRTRVVGAVLRSVPANADALVVARAGQQGGDEWVSIDLDHDPVMRAVKPECPSSSCSYDARLGRCNRSWDSCPFTAAVWPTKSADPAGLADLLDGMDPADVAAAMQEGLAQAAPQIRRAIQEQVVAAKRALSGRYA